ncbi:hypothetical protein DPMN_086092 [Dreissena polymorpha]|uniref:Neurotransmitter-gated ion-channel ligand-binding domain-containing protein n=1 Tax=Dreissena polymorpha TaxID=45954 RepID=A0A9D4BKU7_DREPO|nr:hypothetical protein DPMN_086092 [Dreissena polymorpha]
MESHPVLCRWNLSLDSGQIGSTCAVDVEIYPFDIQMCKLSFSAMGYEFNEVFVMPESDQANMTLFTEHPMWYVFDTQASSEQYK